MAFGELYANYLDNLCKESTGERLRRLQEGLGHAECLFLERVWYPAFGHFDHLHAEYEVDDFKDGSRFLDFAYLRPPYRICFEIDGYGPHVRDISRWQHSDHLQRQNHLIFDDWKVFRFTYDDIKERPRRCQQTVQQVVGKYYGGALPAIHLTLKEKEILQFVIHRCQPVTPKAVASRLDICDKHARRLLHSLQEKKLLQPASGTVRVRSYTLNTENMRRDWY